MSNELIDPSAEGFKERVTPKLPEESSGVFFFKCPSCGGTHFRHAGYMESMVPFMRAGLKKRIGVDSLHVKVCVKCRKAFVWLNEQMYDVTDQIDLEAWEKAERELHKATGPGGDC